MNTETYIERSRKQSHRRSTNTHGSAAYLDGKPEGNKSMLAKGRSLEGVEDVASRGPGDKVKTKMFESQCTSDEIRTSPDHDAYSMRGCRYTLFSTPRAEAIDRQTVGKEPTQGHGRDTYVALERLLHENVGSSKGREPQDDGVSIVVVGVATHLGGRESRLQGEGKQVLARVKRKRYA